MDKKTANLHVRWEPSSHEELLQQAERRDSTAAHLARRILRAWLRSHGNHEAQMCDRRAA
jgi:hypothetical protein